MGFTILVSLVDAIIDIVKPDTEPSLDVLYASVKKIPVRHIDSILKDSFSSEHFSIRNIKDLLQGKDLVQELHRHDFFLILALKKGKGSHEIDFTPYAVKDNSVFLLRPGQVHQLTLKAGSEGYLIQFKPDFYYPDDKESAQLLRTPGSNSLCQFDADKFKKLHSVLTYIFQEYTSRQEKYQDVIKANLDIFFIELFRNRQNKKSTSSPTTSYAQQRLDDFFELLETNIFKHKQVSQYADMLNLTTYQLNAITRSTLDKTCSELINERIILESKRFLLATSSQVTQIAYNLGYEDVSYFIRFFKKHTGYSPETFRHNFK